jgi:pyridoxamine 5'-phosphate oxidase
MTLSLDADPQAVLAQVVEQLSAGVASAKHPFHLLTVATVGLDGRPQARTVVLRAVLPEARSIRFHTDYRSPKVRELLEHPSVLLLWYDPQIKRQLRVAAQARVHHADEVARAHWLASAARSRACYASPFAPSSELGEADWPAAPEAVEADHAEAFRHFCVVDCRWERIEILDLHASGHQRLLLTWHEQSLHAAKLAP